MSSEGYRIQSMAEIEALPWNGVKVVSTFSGAGGSCLGYRMAGCKVLWASEFVEEAQKVYRAVHPGVHLDTRDIRTVTPEHILEQTGLKVGEIDIFDGSPPCSAFSMCGKRSEGWGEVKKYSTGKRQVVDDLFFEYARLLEGLQPKTFIAENVKGLTMGNAKGYLNLILRRLKDAGYSVQAKVLNASWLGVPQKRERLIFMGVRNDLNKPPAWPRPSRRQVTLREALEGVPKPRKGEYWQLPKGIMVTLWNASPRHGGLFSSTHQRMFGTPGYYSHTRARWDKPTNTVIAMSQSVYHPDEPRTLSIAELRRVCSFPDDFIVFGSFAVQWERFGRAVPPLMMKAVADCICSSILTVTTEGESENNERQG